VNMIGNAVATLVIARWENELDRTVLANHLRGPAGTSEGASVPGVIAK